MVSIKKLDTVGGSAKLSSSQKISFMILFLAINLYSLLVPLRILFSNNIYFLLEVSTLSLMIILIFHNIQKKPSLLKKYDVEFFIFYVLILLLLLGTLVMRSDASINELASYLRLLIVPFTAGILTLTSEFNMKEVSRKKIWIYVPIIPLLLSAVSSIIQLIKPEIIKNIVYSNSEFMFAGLGTNFLSGSIHNRLLGIFFDPNLFGGFLVLNILFILLYFIEKDKLLMGLVINIPLLLFLFLTVSRSALLTIFLCLFVFIVLSMNLRKKFILKGFKYTIIITFLLSFVFILIVGLFSTLNMSLSNLIESRFLVDFNEVTTFNGRTGEWSKYFETFFQNPLSFLLGVDSYYLHYSGAAIENTFIGLIVKYGIFIFLLITIYISRMIRKSKLTKEVKGVLITFIVLSCLVSDIDTLQHITVPLFIYLGLANSRGNKILGKRIEN